MAVAFPLPTPAVELVDGAVLIHDLTETDEAVVAVVRDADDPTEGVSRCLRIGAQAIRAVGATIDTHIVEKRFDAMSDRFDNRVEGAVGQIAETARELLDEDDGLLSRALAEGVERFEMLIGSTFDPDSKQSVVAVFETVLRDAHREQSDHLRKLVAIDGEDSPLGKLKVEMTRELRDQVDRVRSEVKDLSEKIVVTETAANIFDLTTQKGFRFEDAVHELVAAIAAPHGDVAEKTGNEAGSTGSKVGDEVVFVNREDTFGQECCFVLEAKKRKLTMRAIHAELDEALANRDATAAIAVFASQEQAPTSVPFHYADDKAIVVLDTETGDDSALRLAYMWARWVARRELSCTEVDELDLERVSAAIADAIRGLEHLSSVKRCHTQAKKSIDQAQTHAQAMADDVRAALDDLEELLG